MAANPGDRGGAGALVESNLHPPSLRAGTVPRKALVDRLLVDPAPVLSVVAPPGYGKTTLLAQWADARGRTARRAAWLSVDRADNDPAVFLADIVAALDRVEPLAPALLRGAPPSGPSVAATIGRRVAATLASMAAPTALVLDHTDLLDDPQCRDAVAEVAAHLPPGSQLAVAARDAPPLPLALLRPRGEVTDIGVGDLAMDDCEARALLEEAGVLLAGADLAELLRRTEGWPVGLYLAALALKAGGPRATAGFAFSGDDRLMADYLRSEVLARLSPRQVSFLTRTAVLDALSGPLCDAVLDAGGSARLLDELEGSNLLLVPLDRHREWYRYHHLFRDLLRAELDRREPELVPALHARAAGWYEAHGTPDAAIDHAQAAGDADRVARLVLNAAFPTYAGGRVDTCRRWFQWFEDQGLVERYPPIAAVGAVMHALLGEPAAAEMWAAAAERGPYEGTLPDGSTMRGWLAQLRVLLCRDGIAAMRREAQVARRGLAPESPWRPMALVLEGVAHLLDGEAERADAILAEAADAALRAGAILAAAIALAERAVAAVDRQDWKAAGDLAQRALAVVRDGQLDAFGPSTLVHGVVARTATHQGDVARAREHLVRAARLRLALTHALPSLAVQARLELARAYLELADPAGARVVLREARDILQAHPDLGVLPQRADELASTLDTIRHGTVGASSLTAAELRLLPLLSTHLSFREIGERLYVSRHTVKTHAISVYRKLGVSSRSEAIERVHEVGLLGE